MKLRSLFALSCCLALMGPAVAKAQDTFTFDSITPNPVTPAFLTSGTVLTSETNPARTATFTVTTPATPGFENQAFDFEAAADYEAAPVAGNTTALVNVSGSLGDTLTLTFDQAVTSFGLHYAVTDASPVSPGPYTFTVAGTTIDTTGLVAGSAGTFEGDFSTSFAATNSVVLTFGGGTSFALDTFVVSPSATAVPEPGTVAFALALGLPAAWQMRRKLARK